MSIREVFIRRTIIFCITSELTKGSHDKDKMWNEKGTDVEKRLLKFSAKGVQIQHLLDMSKNAILSKQFVRQVESVVSKQYQKRWCYADKPNLFSTIPASCFQTKFTVKEASFISRSKEWAIFDLKWSDQKLQLPIECI